MSNLGLERYLKGIGLSLVRTPVGDRYVVDQMRKHGYNVGGEQSGHIVLSDFVTTGDGLVTALQILAVVVSTGKTVSQVTNRFEALPQILKNVRYANGSPLEDSRVVRAIDAGKAKLGEGGRLVIRPSGTEPVIRVMAEGDDEQPRLDRGRRHRRRRARGRRRLTTKVPPFTSPVMAKPCSAWTGEVASRALAGRAGEGLRAQWSAHPLARSSMLRMSARPLPVGEVKGPRSPETFCLRFWQQLRHAVARGFERVYAGHPFQNETAIKRPLNLLPHIRR